MNDHSSQTQFQLILASLTMILLSFFVFLNAYSRVTPEKQTPVLASVRSNFPATFSSLLREKDGGTPPVLKLPASIQRFIEKRPQGKTAILGGDGQVDGGPAFIRVGLQLKSLFAESDDQLLPTHIAFLQTLANEVTALGYQVEVELRFSTPVGNLPDAPWDLALLRFAAVVRLLIDSGIPAERINGGAQIAPAAALGAPLSEELLLTFREQRAAERAIEEAGRKSPA